MNLVANVPSTIRAVSVAMTTSTGASTLGAHCLIQLPQQLEEYQSFAPTCVPLVSDNSTHGSPRMCDTSAALLSSPHVPDTRFSATGFYQMAGAISTRSQSNKWKDDGNAPRNIQPGCVTGVYHIFISNWPRGTKWRDIRDWVRPVAEVDHVEIFPDGTSGWVRVRGEMLFRQTLARLQNVYVKGRRIAADARNATAEIPVRALKVGGGSLLPSAESSVPVLPYITPRLASMTGHLQTAWGPHYMPPEHFGLSSYSTAAFTDYSSSQASSSFYSQTSMDCDWDGFSISSLDIAWSMRRLTSGQFLESTRRQALGPGGPAWPSPTNESRKEKTPDTKGCPDVNIPADHDSQPGWQPPVIVNGSNRRPPKRQQGNDG